MYQMILHSNSHRVLGHTTAYRGAAVWLPQQFHFHLCSCEIHTEAVYTVGFEVHARHACHVWYSIRR